MHIEHDEDCFCRCRDCSRRESRVHAVCTCGREWPCHHYPPSWHSPFGVRIEENEETT